MTHLSASSASPTADTDAELVLRVRDLSIGFGPDTSVLPVVDGVSLELRRGDALGLVGESGCGKTVTGLALMRLLPARAARVLSGSVEFQNRDLLKIDAREMRSVRGNDISMIFQEPAQALNPVARIRAQMLECFTYHPRAAAKFGAGFDTREKRVRELLERVGIPDPPRALNSYPHQLSGGMLQRVMIAMAIALEPRVLIADEPTTALDVTVQAQIMELLNDLRRETGTAIILITHNLGLVARYADRLAVMYAGRIVEEASVNDFLSNPLHPYSRGLLDALPNRAGADGRLKPIPGSVPAPADFPSGCRFRDRCAHAFEACVERPVLRSSGENRRVACFL